MPTGVYVRKPQPYRDPAPRFWKKVRKTEDCWEWLGGLGGPHGDGYGKFWVRGRNVVASRFSYELHGGQIPDGLWVLHHCDNAKCVRPDHLFLGAVQDNVQDAIAKGRWNYEKRTSENYVRGVDQHTAKLNEQQVREIRARYIPREVSQRMLAREYGVTRNVIRLVVIGATWKHVTETP